MPQKSGNRTIYIVGFGSQASAWAQCLRQSGWLVKVYLSRKGGSFQRATELGFQPAMIQQLRAEIEKDIGTSSSTAWVAMLCPDTVVAPVYQEVLAELNIELRLILAHGFPIYSGELKLLKAQHQATLLAPKAIGPKLLQSFQTHFPEPHRLCAALHLPADLPKDHETLVEIAKGLGFHPEFLIPATFHQETVGDLMSEQGLLCGGVFNLMRWTMEAMLEAGVPESLIREECLTELELIAGLIRDKGPANAFLAISQAAQCGTVAMANRLNESGFKKDFQSQMASIQKGEFSRFFQSQAWQLQAKELIQELSNWQERFHRKTELPELKE